MEIALKLFLISTSIFLVSLGVITSSPDNKNSADMQIDSKNKTNILGEMSNKNSKNQLFKINSTKSKADISSTDKGKINFQGTFKIKNGYFVLDTKTNKITEGVIIIDTSSLQLNQPSDNVLKSTLLNILKSEKIFSVYKFNTATIKIINSEKTHLSIQIKIKDQQREMQIPANITFNNKELNINTEFSLSRKDWNMNINQESPIEDIKEKILSDTIDVSLQVSSYPSSTAL